MIVIDLNIEGMPDELRTEHGELIRDTLMHTQQAAELFSAQLALALGRCVECKTLNRHCPACYEAMKHILDQSATFDQLRQRLLDLSQRTDDWRDQQRKDEGDYNA